MLLAMPFASPIPFHVLVDAPIPKASEFPSDQVWLAASAVATLVLAVFTWRLAARTAQMAKETLASVSLAARAITEENRRFVEGLQPHIVPFEREVPGGGGKRAIRLVNVGPGFARNISVHFTHRFGNALTSLAVPALAANGGEETIGGDAMPANNLRIEYSDALGNRFQTVVDGAFSAAKPYTTRKIED
jgi:hypothetical protein